MAEPLNATFFAFQKRERGGVLMRASIGFLIGGAALLALFAFVFWGALLSALSWYGQLLSASMTGDEAALAAIGFPAGVLIMLPGFLLWMFFFYVLFAAYEAACLRWMVHGESVGVLGLALDAQTWRVYGGYWVWYGLYLASATALSIVFVGVLSVLAVAGAASGAQASDAGMMAASFGLGAALLYIGYYGALIYFGVRLAPAAATSIARRKFSFFHAWNVTRERFWALFGSFFLLIVIYCLFAIVFGVALFAAVLALAAPELGWSANLPSEPSVMVVGVMERFIGALQQPQTWLIFGLLQIVGLAVAMVFYVAMFGVNARAVSVALQEGKIALPQT
ncbi:MAG: hypothetical protein AB7G40_16655 [Hyphomonadaceae bacterium]